MNDPRVMTYQIALAAMEYGYRSAERGMSIQAARSEFRKLWTVPAPKPSHKKKGIRP